MLSAYGWVNLAGSSHLSAVSWGRFFDALGNYAHLFKGSLKSERSRPPSFRVRRWAGIGGTPGGMWNRGASGPSLGKVEFQSDELEGLLAWLRLLTRVASQVSSNGLKNAFGEVIFDPGPGLPGLPRGGFRVAGARAPVRAPGLPHPAPPQGSARSPLWPWTERMSPGGMWEALAALAAGPAAPAVWSHLGQAGVLGSGPGPGGDAKPSFALLVCLPPPLCSMDGSREGVV